MAGFATTLVATVTGPGPLTFTAISSEGAVIATGLTEFVFPDNGKRFQVQVVDGSNSSGAFQYRLMYKGNGGTVKLIDVVSAAAGEVLKSFAVESPLLEVLGDGTRSISAEAIIAIGAPADGCLVVIVVQRET